jgi:hypothetical protein
VGHRRTIATAVATAVALAVPAAGAPAQAPSYPPPSNPGSVQKKPRGPFKTLRVGRNERYKTIQAAVNAARAGDTIRVRPGVYRESVRISGARHRYLKIIGDPANPQRVVLDGEGRRQNGITVNGADAVTLRGLKARRYRANAFFVVNVTGYAMDRLIAERPGTYGLYAFNSKGGSMTNSLSYYAADGAYYVGQTPRQTRPLRTIIRNVVGWGSVAGYTGTNSRYVTITRSKFFNNAIGIVPNSLDSERFPPDEQNVIRDNDVFWNNFDVYRRAPFVPNRNEQFAYPPGIGIILLSGRDNRIEDNRIYGNWLSGFIGVQNPFLKNPADQPLDRNVVSGNRFGRDGTDRNGRDLVYSGSGSGNCFGGNAGVETTIPADPAAFPACPFTGKNADNQDTILAMLEWAVNGRYRDGWIQHPHAAQPGIEPLVDWQPGRRYGPTTL